MHEDTETLADQLTRVVDLDDEPSMHPTLPRSPEEARHEAYELADVEWLLPQRVSQSFSLRFVPIALVFRHRFSELQHVLVAPVQE